ncbi:MAG: adenylate/guanylate cyclase domain-containing protein [Coriobacteriales bacterium]|nr:adenylate/guanylate cyclase domain-containing protein [Coriobacteriales bacterium]
MKQVNSWNREQGYPEIEMGIGIHTGEAIMGCIGSETRMKYDAIGRNVNLAARLVSYAQGGQIYVSDATLAEAGDDIVERPEGKQFVTPKGIAGEICIHDIAGIGSLRLPS